MGDILEITLYALACPLLVPIVIDKQKEEKQTEEQ